MRDHTTGPNVNTPLRLAHPTPEPDNDYDDPYNQTTNPLTDPTAEKALLGALLLAPQYAPQAAQELQPGDFYQPRHETIWTAIHSITDHPADPITLAAQLTKQGQLQKIGGANYLHDLITACPNPANLLTYAGEVRNQSRRRQLHQTATKLQTLATKGNNLEDALADALQTLDQTAARLGPATHTAAVDYVPFDGLFTRPRIPIQWVTAPILATGRVTLLYSPGKTGKSLIAIEAAAAIATGRPALATTQPTQPQHVLYIDQEMTQDDWIDRLTDMGYNTSDEHNLATYLHLAQLQNWPPMDTPTGGKTVETEALRIGATTVIIDTASKVIAGEENANDTQQAFYRNTLIPLKRAGIAVLVLDHTGKDLERGARGASAKTDNIDFAFELLQRGKDLLTLRCTHARVRDPLLQEPTFLRRTATPLAHVVEETPTGGYSGPGMRPTHLMEKVSRYVEANPGASKTSIETAVKGKVEYVRLALELLVLESYIATERGARNTQMHTQIKPFREDENQ